MCFRPLAGFDPTAKCTGTLQESGTGLRSVTERFRPAVTAAARSSSSEGGQLAIHGDAVDAMVAPRDRVRIPVVIGQLSVVAAGHG